MRSEAGERRVGSLHALSLGVCALCAQVIFIRELMALFTGTEFVIGTLVAGWLLWVGIGGLAGGRVIGRLGRPRFILFLRLGVSAALLLPATVVGIRLGRGLICAPPGNIPPLSEALVFALLVIAPFGLVYGALYNIASTLWRDEKADMRGSISRVYIWEAIGSLCGALLFSFVLLRFFSQFTASMVVSATVIAILLLRDRASSRIWPRLSALLLFVLLLLSVARPVDLYTIRAIFPGYHIEASETSRYSEIVVASREGSLTFFAGGARLFSIPEPERVEETVHIPLLSHANPRDLLLIGGSLGGGWQEALEHPTVRRVDCLEIDGALLRLSMEHDPGMSFVQNGGDGTAEVDLIETDGRYFLSRKDRRYDVIILSAPPPINLQWNRYYTKEFFAIVERSLASNGLFAFSHPSSENFLSIEQVHLLAALDRTLGEVFRDRVVLPGSSCYFIGGRATLETDTLLARLDRRGIETSYVSEEFLPFRFSPERLRWMEEVLDSSEGAIVNTDSRPSLPFLELVLEGERLDSGVVRLLSNLQAIPRPFLLALLALVPIIALSIPRGKGAPRIAVLSVGLSAFVFQLAVMLAYQSHTGLLYHAIILLTALFMGGAAVGAAYATWRPSIRRIDLRAVHAGFVLLSLVLVAWYGLPSWAGVHLMGWGGLFHLLSGLGGVLTGSYYAMVVRSAFRGAGGPPALFYAYDLFGAAVGGMLGGLVIFPLTGVLGAALLILSIHLAASLFLVRRW